MIQKALNVFPLWSTFLQAFREKNLSVSSEIHSEGMGTGFGVFSGFLVWVLVFLRIQRVLLCYCCFKWQSKRVTWSGSERGWWWGACPVPQLCWCNVRCLWSDSAAADGRFVQLIRSLCQGYPHWLRHLKSQKKKLKSHLKKEKQVNVKVLFQVYEEFMLNLRSSALITAAPSPKVLQCRSI